MIKDRKVEIIVKRFNSYHYQANSSFYFRRIFCTTCIGAITFNRSYNKSF